MAEISLEFHVDQPEAIELCRDYWLLEKPGAFLFTVADVSATHEVPASGLARLIGNLCSAISGAISCELCGCPYEFQSRSDYLQKRRQGSWTTWKCEDCVEAEREVEKREREDLEALKHRVLQAAYDAVRQNGLEVCGLEFRGAIYLLALLRFAGSEDLEFLVPCESISGHLTPTLEMDMDVLNYLYRNNLICIHPRSRPESVFFEGREFTKFFPQKVHWVLPLAASGPSPAAFMEQLEALLRGDRWPNHWEGQDAELYQEVALQECLQYLRVVVEDHGFELRVGEKTLLVLREVLKRFSVAQAYNFMWRAAKDAAAFYVRKETSRRHAANTIPGAIQRMADHATAEDWDVKAYRRDFRAPRSVISQVLFDVALEIGESGFTSVPPAALQNPDGEV